MGNRVFDLESQAPSAEWTKPPGRQKSRRSGFFSFHDLRQRVPQKVEKSKSSSSFRRSRLAALESASQSVLVKPVLFLWHTSAGDSRAELIGAGVGAGVGGHFAGIHPRPPGASGFCQRMTRVVLVRLQVSGLSGELIARATCQQKDEDRHRTWHTEFHRRGSPPGSTVSVPQRFASFKTAVASQLATHREDCSNRLFFAIEILRPSSRIENSHV